ISPSSKKPYGVARVVGLWNLARSRFYAARHRERHPREAQKRGPKVLSDAELVTAIRQLVEECVFSGEGYRKIWARLRQQGIRTSKDRVLQLLRENSCSRRHGSQSRFGAIRTRGQSSPNGPIRCGELMLQQLSPTRMVQ